MGAHDRGHHKKGALKRGSALSQSMVMVKGHVSNPLALEGPHSDGGKMRIFLQVCVLERMRGEEMEGTVKGGH